MTNRPLSFIIHRAVRHSANKNGGIAQLVEHSVHTRSVICSSQIAATRPVGQKVKTPPFHGGNMGSIPVRVTKKETIRMDGFFFGYSYVGLTPSGSITSILPSSDGRDAAHRSFWRSQKKMRRDTEPAQLAEYRPEILCVSTAAAPPPKYSRAIPQLIYRAHITQTRGKIGEDFLPSWRLFLGSGGRLFIRFPGSWLRRR